VTAGAGGSATTGPAVSVVMPVYNGETFLEEALLSVLTQSLRDIEVIVVDDGSTDRTPEILAYVTDPRVRVLTQPNGGIAAALNFGVAHARGRYVARMDADDRCVPERLDRQVSFLETHPEVAAVGSSYRLIDESGAYLGVFGTLVGDQELRRDLFVRCPFGHGTMMREALWSTATPPRLSPARALSDLAVYRRSGSEVRTALVAAYLREHRSLFVEALRRRRWGTAYGLLPAMAVLGSYGSMWAAARSMSKKSPWSPVGTGIRRPRVLVLGHDASRSGAAGQLLHVLEQWAAAGDLELLVVLRRGGPLLPRYERCGPVVTLMPTWTGAVRSRVRGRRSPRGGKSGVARPPQPPPAKHGREWPGIAKKWLFDNPAIALNRTIHSFKADVVFANTATHGDIIRRLGDVPLVTYVHEQEAFLEQITLPRQLNRLLRRSTTVVAASASVCDDLVLHHGVRASAVDVVHPFAPPALAVERDAARAQLQHESGTPADTRYVGACGALTWNKAPDSFVELAAAVRERLSAPVAFVWLGADPTGEMRPQLVAAAHARSVGDVVRFLSPRESTASFFAALDVFALVSRTDSFGVVVLEAARQAVPTVCFATSGGAREFVQGDAGVVIPTRDVAAMAEAVVSLLRDEELRCRLGSVAQTREATEHSPSAVSARLQTIVIHAARTRSAPP
jgi:glycosyltransferase involved in cell wall biosynthesis